MSTVTPDCPIYCLAPLLSQPTFAALICGLDPFVTVGDVAKLCKHRRLMELRGIGPSRAGEIRRCLVDARVVDPSTSTLIWRDRRDLRTANGHHISCTAQQAAFDDESCDQSP